jgi:hypothetical protein
MRTDRAKDAAIVMFGDGRDWHGKSLMRAFKRRGITPLLAPLNACGFSTETATGLAIPGLGDRLPEGAFVRFVPGGSFEEVTLYLGVLHALRELGVVVWNDARAIERCVDKSTTTFFLQRAGLPTPRTFARVGLAEAEAIAASLLAEGRQLVQKPLFGAQGKGLRLISSLANLAPPEEVNGVYYLQEFIPPAQEHHQDWRIFVCQGRVIASMIRHGSSWITNIKQGARAKAAIASQELIDPLRGVLARLIALITPGDIQYSFFSSSGTEAIEGAIKLAKMYTRKNGFIVAVKAFHGKTMGSLSMMGKSDFRQPLPADASGSVIQA